MAQQHCLSAGPPASDDEASFRAFKGFSAGQTAAPSSPLFSGCLPTQWTSSACAQKKLLPEKEKGKEGVKKSSSIEWHSSPQCARRSGPSRRCTLSPGCVSPPGSDATGETLKPKEDGKKTGQELGGGQCFSDTPLQCHSVCVSGQGRRWSTMVVRPDTGKKLRSSSCPSKLVKKDQITQYSVLKVRCLKSGRKTIWLSYLGHRQAAPLNDGCTKWSLIEQY